MSLRLQLYFHKITVFSLGIAQVGTLILGANLAGCRQQTQDHPSGATRTSNRVGQTRDRASASAYKLSGPADSVPSQPQPKIQGDNREITAGTTTIAKPTVRFVGKAGVRSAKGKFGMVVSVEPQATRVGVEVLEAGGSAVDAAVAVALALAVTHPSAGNIGGGGFWLIHKKNEATAAIDFRETTPAILDRARFDQMVRSGGVGGDSVGVPGTIAGLFEAHARYGRLPWNRVVMGAVGLAQKGHRVGIAEATALHKAWPALKVSSQARATFALENGRVPVVGSWVKRPALARTLEIIRDQGPDGFYRGAVAESIVKALRDSSQLSLKDLAEYRARWRAPRQINYRGLLVEMMPLPSAGGAALTEELNLLQEYDVAKMQYGSSSHIHLLLEIQRRGDSDRISLATDPDLLDGARLQALESRFLDPHAWDSYPIDPKQATPNLRDRAPANSRESVNTTHFSVVDADQTAVSATMTLSAAFGSKVVTESGITLNNTLASFAESGGNQPQPRRRTTSSMAPTFVFDELGLVLVLGTPGGDSIASTLMQVLSNLVDFNMPLDAAVDSPRVYQSFAPDTARYEALRPINASVRKQLTRMGHNLSGNSAKLGHANCILLGDSDLFGYADPREGGLALAPRFATSPRP